MTNEELTHTIEDIITAASNWAHHTEVPLPPEWEEAFTMFRELPPLLEAIAKVELP